MATDDPKDPGADVYGQLQDVLGRLGAAAGHLPGVASVTSRLPELPHVPLPGALSAAQVEAVVSAVRAQRATIAATRVSLDAFEQQLVVLEELLEPLTSVTGQWAAVERYLAPGTQAPATD